MPIVCWQAEADEAAGWDMGDKISVRGRMQSRTYIKVVRGEATERIAREISARKVTRVKHDSNYHYSNNLHHTGGTVRKEW